MTPKGKKIAWTIGSLIVLGGGAAAAWFLYFKPKIEKDKADKERERLRQEQEAIETGAPPTTGGGGGSASSDDRGSQTGPSRPTEKATIKNFQEYANSRGADLDVDGVWGPMTQGAWDKFGADYVKSGGKTPQMQSFDAIKKFFGFKAKKYGNRITYTADQSKFGLSLGLKGTKIKAVFFAVGGWRLYVIQPSSTTPKFLSGGLYSGGGTKLVVKNGRNKGMVIEGPNPLNNLTKAGTK